MAVTVLLELLAMVMYTMFRLVFTGEKAFTKLCAMLVVTLPPGLAAA